MKITRIILVLSFLSSVFFVGCSNNGPTGYNIKNTDYAAFKNYKRNEGIDNQTAFILDGINGSIKISPVEGDLATITGEIKVQSESEEDAAAYLEKLDVIVEKNENEIHVYPDQPGDNRGRILTITYNVKLPAKLTTTITNINGDVQIDSLNETITVNVTNGNIILNEIHASVNTALVNGTIDSRIILPENGTCNMDLTSGVINLEIPQNTNAAFNAKIISGSVNVYNLTKQIKNVTSTSTSYTGTIGTGNGSIELHAVNGSITVSGY